MTSRELSPSMLFVNGRRRVGYDAGFREWAGMGSCVHTGKKIRFCLKTEKGLWVMKHIAIGILGAATLGFMASAASATTLDTVKAKGEAALSGCVHAVEGK